ncbi:MAG: aminotransferase class I/II-fold pyridoxal phosphate-dependent enzyme [Candidatus Marinimicrobia bacterium]|nr:aminotransferase class I/II-fold pyridoxal phosphate-dependent enzyme [Candidatus Neomarinimicrobiota bacterium]
MIPDLQPSKIREMHGLAGPDSVNLGLGQPVLDLPPEFINVVNRVMREDDLGYTGYAGLPELREAIANRVCGKSGTGDNVSITVGTTEGLFATLLTLLQPDDEVLIPDPGFVLYEAVIKIVGGQPVTYPVYSSNDFDLHVDDITERITSRTRAIVLNSPNNPTGRIIKRAQLEQLADIAASHDLYIISDEVYDTIDYTGEFTSAWGLTDKTIVLGGASKTFAMTGWRLGWVIGDLDIMSKINIAHHYMVACAPAIAQRVMARLLTGDGDIGETVRQQYQDEYIRRRQTMLDAIHTDLPEWEYITPEGAFYLMLKIPENLLATAGSSEQFARDLITSQDTVTIPGSAFGNEGEGYVRLSFAVTPDTIREGISRMAQYEKEMS